MNEAPTPRPRQPPRKEGGRGRWAAPPPPRPQLFRQWPFGPPTAWQGSPRATRQRPRAGLCTWRRAGWPSSRRPQASSGMDHCPMLTALKPWDGKVKVTVLGSPALHSLALERLPALASRCLPVPTSGGGGVRGPIQMTCSQGLDPFEVWAGLGSPGAASGSEVLRGVCCPPRSCLFQGIWGLQREGPQECPVRGAWLSREEAG